MKKIISAIVSGSLAFLLVGSVVAMEEKEEGPIEVSSVKNFPYCDEYVYNEKVFDGSDENIREYLYLSQNNCALQQQRVIKRPDGVRQSLPRRQLWLANRFHGSCGTKIRFDDDETKKRNKSEKFIKQELNGSLASFSNSRHYSLSPSLVDRQDIIFDGPNENGDVFIAHSYFKGNENCKIPINVIHCLKTEDEGYLERGVKRHIETRRKEETGATATAIAVHNLQTAAYFATRNLGQECFIKGCYVPKKDLPSLSREKLTQMKAQKKIDKEVKKLCFLPNKNSLFGLSVDGGLFELSLNDRGHLCKEKNPTSLSGFDLFFISDLAVNMFLPSYIVYLVKENKEADKQKLILEKRALEDSGQKPKCWTLLDNLKHVTRIWSCEDRVGYMTEEPITSDPKGEEDEEGKKVAKQKMAMNIFTVPSLTKLVAEKKEVIKNAEEQKRAKEARERREIEAQGEKQKQKKAKARKKRRKKLEEARDESDKEFHLNMHKLEQRLNSLAAKQRVQKMFLYTAGGVALLGTCAIAYKVLQNNTGADTIVKASTSGVAQAAKNKTLWQKAGSFIGSLFSEIGLW